MEVWSQVGWGQVGKVRRQLFALEAFPPRIPDAGEGDAGWERCT